MWRAQRAVNAPVRPVAVRLRLCAPIHAGKRLRQSVRVPLSQPGFDSRCPHHEMRPCAAPRLRPDSSAVERHVEGVRVGGSIPFPGTTSCVVLHVARDRLEAASFPDPLMVSDPVVNRFIQVRALVGEPSYLRFQRRILAAETEACCHRLAARMTGSRPVDPGSSPAGSANRPRNRLCLRSTRTVTGACRFESCRGLQSPGRRVAANPPVLGTGCRRFESDRLDQPSSPLGSVGRAPRFERGGRRVQGCETRLTPIPLPSSSGQDAGFSSQEHRFESDREHQVTGASPSRSRHRI